jgi:lathosterol oxidase
VKPVFAWLASLSLAEAMAYALLENTLLLLAALALGTWLVRRFAAARVAPPPPPLATRELILAVVTVLANAVVTVAGWLLWRRGLVMLRLELAPARVLVDVLVLLLAMDAAMFALHWLIHRPPFFWVHRMHHDYPHPRPLTLFVLSPLEVLGFGALWLALMSVYTATWLGVGLYLALNLLYGTVGHLGVQPFSAAWARRPIVRWLAGSRFHADHHQQPHANFGFYTRIWDRLFRTGV